MLGVQTRHREPGSSGWGVEGLAFLHSATNSLLYGFGWLSHGQRLSPPIRAEAAGPAGLDTTIMRERNSASRKSCLRFDANSGERERGAFEATN